MQHIYTSVRARCGGIAPNRTFYINTWMRRTEGKTHACWLIWQSCARRRRTDESFEKCVTGAWEGAPSCGACLFYVFFATAVYMTQCRTWAMRSRRWLAYSSFHMKPFDEEAMSPRFDDITVPRSSLSTALTMFCSFTSKNATTTRPRRQDAR